MAKDFRTLKLELLAETKQFVTDMKKGEAQVETFGDKAAKMGAAAKAAFAAAAAAAAAYAVKLAVDGVKAAIEDEAAQKRLANALENVTGATNAQIAAVEQQILKTSLATGVADDQLRPAYQRLAVATGDLTKSNDLLTLALDISAATGKDVETVSNALGKAYEGNTGALTRLGVGLSAAEIKTLGLEGAVTELANTFGGAAATQADTFQGKMARVQVAFDEAKETLGAALLPIIERFFQFIVQTAIPKMQEFKKLAIDPVIKAFKDNEDAIRSLFNFGKTFLIPFITFTLGNAVKGLATVASGIVNAVQIALRALEPIINAAIAGINAIITAKNLLTGGADTPTIKPISFASAGAGKSANTVPSSSLPSGFTVSEPKVTASGGTIVTAPTVSSTPSAPARTTPVISGAGGVISSAFNPAAFRAGEERSMGSIVINVNSPSIIDEDGFSRAVVNALNESTNRGTVGGGSIRTSAQIL